MTGPVISSLLDTDFYKFTMQQAIFHHYPDALVEARFHCRTNTNLAPLAERIREEVVALAGLRLSPDERQWMEATGLFRADYLDYLQATRLDPDCVTIGTGAQGLEIDIQGSWLEITLFEIYILAIVSELYGRYLEPVVNLDEGRLRLSDKLDQLRGAARQRMYDGFSFVDFGTRRRFSGVWQRELIGCLAESVPAQFTGTSNVMLAREFGLRPVGTMAHEWLQAHQALTPDLGSSQKQALKVWLEEYGSELGIALTDTINMDAFLNDFNRGLAQAYQGVRHDSGDPIVWGEKAIAHYESLGIDPLTRTLVFSDGLNLDMALNIFRHFRDRIRVSFGIGTWLTNDVGVSPLSIVLKLVSCNGQPVAKISDAPGKTLCLDQGYIAQLRHVYGLC